MPLLLKSEFLLFRLKQVVDEDGCVMYDGSEDDSDGGSDGAECEEGQYPCYRRDVMSGGWRRGVKCTER